MNEWKYVFTSRGTTSGIRYAKAIVNDCNVIILLPNDWADYIVQSRAVGAALRVLCLPGCCRRSRPTVTVSRAPSGRGGTAEPRRGDGIIGRRWNAMEPPPEKHKQIPIAAKNNQPKHKIFNSFG